MSVCVGAAVPENKMDFIRKITGNKVLLYALLLGVVFLAVIWVRPGKEGEKEEAPRFLNLEAGDLSSFQYMINERATVDKIVDEYHQARREANRKKAGKNPYLLPQDTPARPFMLVFETRRFGGHSPGEILDFYLEHFAGAFADTFSPGKSRRERFLAPVAYYQKGPLLNQGLPVADPKRGLPAGRYLERALTDLLALRTREIPLSLATLREKNPGRFPSDQKVLEYFGLARPAESLVLRTRAGKELRLDIGMRGKEYFVRLNTPAERGFIHSFSLAHIMRKLRSPHEKFIDRQVLAVADKEMIQGIRFRTSRKYFNRRFWFPKTAKDQVPAQPDIQFARVFRKKPAKKGKPAKLVSNWQTVNPEAVKLNKKRYQMVLRRVPGLTGRIGWQQIRPDWRKKIWPDFSEAEQARQAGCLARWDWQLVNPKWKPLESGNTPAGKQNSPDALLPEPVAGLCLIAAPRKLGDNYYWLGRTRDGRMLLFPRRMLKDFVWNSVK